MATSGGTADYVSTVQGLIFGPTEAYNQQLKAWSGTVMQFLDKVYPQGAATVPAIGDLVQIVNNAMLSGALALAPVLKEYKGTADLTTDIKQTTDDKIGASVGGTLSVVSLNLAYSHDQGTQSANAQNYHLEYEIEVPLPDGDRVTAAAQLWLAMRAASTSAHTA